MGQELGYQFMIKSKVFSLSNRFRSASLRQGKCSTLLIYGGWKKVKRLERYLPNQKFMLEKGPKEDK